MVVCSGINNSAGVTQDVRRPLTVHLNVCGAPPTDDSSRSSKRSTLNGRGARMRHMNNSGIFAMQKCALIAVAGLAMFAASAVQAQEVYGNIGTEGLGAGVGYSFESHDNVRADFNGIGLSHNFNAGGAHYDGKLSLYHGGLYADFFPVPGIVGVRLTAGVLIGGDNLAGDATNMSGTYTLNGVTVPANGETIHAKAQFPSVRPYLGIGFGHNPLSRGLSFFFDAGVAFGKPKLTYDVPADIVAAAGQANVDAEKASLQYKVNRVKVYPIVKVGLAYRF
ncbi:hypothetical protein RI103_36280 [Paraburkholderia sp. FT54]|uniref:hypothetical protein n=1 Tax=Paraburkholderia sp. FT54 TaxID=3074437 RepID=UPI002877E0FE|nr:hypothetical protein [Paraburkholderia sp. FT54]WNC94600.1 hypothetical protein RI103_36280 [Paraburkholderia sp. FT54]